MFPLDSTKGDVVDYYLALDVSSGSANWEFVRLGTDTAAGRGPGSKGFYVDNAHGGSSSEPLVRVLWNSGFPDRGPEDGNLWRGWLACDWIHGLCFRFVS